MNKLQRYEPNYHQVWFPHVLERNPKGDWVKYKDVEKLLRRITKLTNGYSEGDEQ